jgi:peptide chain release factor
MELQISAGEGPVECELAAGLFLEALKAEYPSLKLLQSAPGRVKGAVKSARVLLPDDSGLLSGTVLWRAESPVRPHHKRKNWFIDLCVPESPEGSDDFKEADVSFQTFKNSGNGGQNINKVETAVRAVHLPTGLTVVAREERSQGRNKELALSRLKEKLRSRALEAYKKAEAGNRLRHARIIRGNPSRIYEGPSFVRIK